LRPALLGGGHPSIDERARGRARGGAGALKNFRTLNGDTSNPEFHTSY
jgi:hypothetical protein